METTDSSIKKPNKTLKEKVFAAIMFIVGLYCLILALIIMFHHYFFYIHYDLFLTEALLAIIACFCFFLFSLLCFCVGYAALKTNKIEDYKFFIFLSVIVVFITFPFLFNTHFFVISPVVSELSVGPAKLEEIELYGMKVFEKHSRKGAIGTLNPLPEERLIIKYVVRGAHDDRFYETQSIYINNVLVKCFTEDLKKGTINHKKLHLNAPKDPGTYKLRVGVYACDDPFGNGCCGIQNSYIETTFEVVLSPLSYDFLILDMKPNTTSPQINQNITFKVAIGNWGGSPRQHTHTAMCYYQEDNKLGCIPVRGLNSREMQISNFTWVCPPTPGTYTIKVIADAEKQIREHNETNNEFIYNITCYER